MRRFIASIGDVSKQNARSPTPIATPMANIIGPIAMEIHEPIFLKIFLRKTSLRFSSAAFTTFVIYDDMRSSFKKELNGVGFELNSHTYP